MKVEDLIRELEKMPKTAEIIVDGRKVNISVSVFEAPCTVTRSMAKFCGMHIEKKW